MRRFLLLMMLCACNAVGPDASATAAREGQYPQNPLGEDLKLPAEQITGMLSATTKGHALEGMTARLVPESESAAATAQGTIPYVDVRGKLINSEYRFVCLPRTFSRLLIPNGQGGWVPLSARVLSYHFSGIQWRAGQGWPVYSVRCPRDDVGGGPYPAPAKRHSLIVQFGGFFWPECLNSHVGAGNQVTDVFVGPQDDRYVDNSGSFEFVVSGYAQ